MCVHSVEDFLEEFPGYDRDEIGRVAVDLSGVFPDIPKDRLGEAVVLCLAGENPALWATFSDDIQHYWDLFIQRATKDALECPHDTASDVQKWMLGRLDSLALMMWEATRKGIGRSQADNMMAEACKVAFAVSHTFLELSTDGTVN